jgi:hypothetical protein
VGHSARDPVLPGLRRLLRRLLRLKWGGGAGDWGKECHREEQQRRRERRQRAVSRVARVFVSLCRHDLMLLWLAGGEGF